MVASNDLPERRVLVVGVSSFGDGLQPLDVEALSGLSESFERCGWTVDRDSDPSVEELRRQLAKVRDGKCSVVHIMTHGEYKASSEGLWLAAKNARGSVVTSDHWLDFRSWLGEAVDIPNFANNMNKLVVFLDTCYAGDAARLDWLDEGVRKIYVFAATEPGQLAFRGRFSRSVQRLLNRLADGDDFGAHPSTEYVSLGLVRNALAAELDQLCQEDNAVAPQSLMTSRHQLRHEHTHSLFRNPRFGRLDSLELGWVKLTRQEPALADSIDPVLGGRHFLTRALGSNPDRDASICHFEGREPELRQLRSWLDTGLPFDGLRIVTGSPGMGKSALLGILVCLMHPELRQFAHRFEHRLGGSLKPDVRQPGQIAAVHARNRDIPELLNSIGRQLKLGPAIDDVDRLLDQLGRLQDTPIIVLDALDEAADPVGLQSRLLIPLVTRQRHGGERLCRLLVGTRDQPRFGPLLALAEQQSVIDLDDTDPQVLRGNVSAYVEDLLREAPNISGPVARAFSASTADAVTPRQGSGSTKRVDVGPFLLAQIHADRMLEGPLSQATKEDAAALGRAAPKSVEEAFAAEFDASANPWLKPLLFAFAHAEGIGMPLRHARAVAQTIARGTLPDLTDVELRDLMVERARFYLRTDIDIDGSMVYGLFHQSLQQHLIVDSERGRTHGSVARLFFAALRKELGDVANGQPDWPNRATPYIRRHFGAHAIYARELDDLCGDPNYLAYSDHSQLMRSLRSVGAPPARRAASVYRASHLYHRVADPHDRLLRIGLDAARIGDDELLASVRKEAGDFGSTRWSSGRAAVYTAITDVHDVGTDVLALASAVVDGRHIVVAGCADGSLQVRDLSTGELVRRIHAHPHAIRAVCCTVLNGKSVAVSATRDSARIWDLATGAAVGQKNRSFHSLSTISVAGRPLLAAAGPDTAIRVYDLTTGSKLHRLRGHRGRVRSTACMTLLGRPTVVGASDSGNTYIWDIVTGTLLHAIRGVADTVACTHIAGYPVIVSAHVGGFLRAWDLVRSREIARLRLRPDELITLTCTVLDGNPVVVVHGAGDAGRVGVWDLVSRKFVRELRGHRSSVPAILCAESEGRPVVITSGGDQSMCWSDVSVKAAPDDSSIPSSAITALASTVIAGETVVVAGCSNGSVALWDIRDGKLWGPAPADPEAPSASVVGIKCVTDNHHPAAVVAYADGLIRVMPLADNDNGWKILRSRPWYRTQPSERLLALVASSGQPLVVSARTSRLQTWNLNAPTSRSFDISDPYGPSDKWRRPFEIVSLGTAFIEGQPISIVAGSSRVGVGSDSWLDREIRGYNIATGLEITRFRAVGVTGVDCIAVNGQPTVVMIGRYLPLRTAELSSGTTVRSFGRQYPWSLVTCASYDGRPVAVVGARDGAVAIWDLQTGEELFSQVFPDRVNAVAIAPDALVVAYGDDIAVLDFKGLVSAPHS